MYICVRIMRDLSTQIVFWFIYWKDLVHLLNLNGMKNINKFDTDFSILYLERLKKETNVKEFLMAGISIFYRIICAATP